MARIRTVKPEFYSDPDLGRLSLTARYLYKSMWSFADDEGCLSADPRLLKSQTFPFDDKIGVKNVAKLVEELQDADKVTAYEVDGLHYLHLPNFKKHQVINKPQPAKHPAPPHHSGSTTGVRTERSTPYTNRTEGKRTPPPPEVGDGGAERKVKDEFLAAGYAEVDIDAALQRIALRKTFGEPVRDPYAWLKAALPKLACVRRDESSGPKQVEIDGVLMEYGDSGWQEVVAV